jgi:hypothetical protein
MVKLELNADGKRWNVTKGGAVVATLATVKEAMAHKSGLTAKAPRTVIGWRQDGTEITRKGRKAA